MLHSSMGEKGRGNVVKKAHVPKEMVIDRVFGATCYSFAQAVEALEQPLSQRTMLTLSEISEVQRDPAEEEASLKFSDCLNANTKVSSLRFQDLELTVDLVEAVKKAVSTDKFITTFSFVNVTCVTPKAGEVIKDAFLQREAGGSLTLSINSGDGRMFQPLIGVTAANRIEFSKFSLEGLHISTSLRRWTLKGTMITKVLFRDIDGLSPYSELMLMKGLRNFVNMKHLSLDNILSNPDSSIILCKSLTLMLHQSSRFNLDIGQHKVGISEASLLKITQLVEGFCIVSLQLKGFRTSLGKRLISTKIISDPGIEIIMFRDANFSDKKDFQLMQCGIKQREITGHMILSRDSVTQEQHRELDQQKLAQRIHFI